MQNWLILVLLLWSGTVHGQARIVGSVSERGKSTMLAGAVVVVSSGQDTLATVVTASDGRFEFDSIVFVPERYYSVKVSKACYNCEFIAIVLEDTVGVQFGELNISCARLSDCPSFDMNAYFNESDSKTILNFDVQALKELMTDYPTMILEFSVCQLPSESIQRGKSRIKTFQKLLKKENLDLTRIQFSSELHYYTTDQLTEMELKPGIFGMIKTLAP